IPIEAGLQGFSVIGGDTSAESLEYARHNAHDAGLGPSVRWLLADATRLPLPDNSVDGIVTNLPWGRQIPASVAALYQAAGRELKRVTRPDGSIVLLMPDQFQPDLKADHLGWRLRSQTEISLFGQTPSILVFQNTNRG